MLKDLVRAFDDADHPVFILDPAHDRIHDANRAACDFLGYERAELLTTAISAVHPAEIDELAGWAVTVQKEGRGWSRTFTCRTKSGDFIPAEIEAFALQEHPLIFVLVRDVSEHRAPHSQNT